MLFFDLQILNYFEEVLKTVGVSRITMMGLCVELMRDSGLPADEVRWSPMRVASSVRQYFRECLCVDCLCVIHGDAHARRGVEIFAPNE